MTNVAHVQTMLAHQQAQADAKDRPRWIDPPEPGLYPGVPYAQYASWDAANHSTLALFDRSPAHARQYLISPPEDTKATAFGSATHCVVFEPDRFDTDYVRAIKVDRRTNIGKAAWSDFLEFAGNRTPLLPEEFESCLAMRDAIWSGPNAVVLKGGVAREISAVWVDEETGVTCKARYDHFGTVYGWSVIVDLKTAMDATAGAFSRAVARYGYHDAAALYLGGANVLAPHERRFLHFVVEKEPPFCTAVFELDEQALSVGRANCRRQLRAYAEAKKTNEWPGYAPGITPLAIPRWAAAQHEQETE